MRNWNECTLPHTLPQTPHLRLAGTAMLSHSCCCGSKGREAGGGAGDTEGGRKGGARLYRLSYPYCWARDEAGPPRLYRRLLGSSPAAPLPPPPPTAPAIRCAPTPAPEEAEGGKALRIDVDACHWVEVSGVPNNPRPDPMPPGGGRGRGWWGGEGVRKTEEGWVPPGGRREGEGEGPRVWRRGELA